MTRETQYNAANFLHRDIIALFNNFYSDSDIANELEIPELMAKEVVASYMSEMDSFFNTEQPPT